MQRRPGFPARLPGAGNAGAKPVAKVSGPASALAARNLVVAAPVGVGLDSSAVRARMVQKLSAGGVTSAQVLQAMGAVERHRFVDSALVNQAYEDTSLPIGLGQTISKPSVVARMCELLLGADGARAGGLGRVLEIGTGCGYQAAVLSLLAREVYTLERLRGLHDRARDNLRPFRLANVHLLFGDGMLGYAKGAPYAAIIAAAGGDAVPQAWCDQLAVGGRLVAPMALSGGQQMLLVIDKTPHGLKQNVLEPVHFVPLKSGIA
ncbi:MAG: protein-L-isoaspartate(D-aspartate) O-methyltransferase [Acidovorax sp.]|uniref:protein-L-isoaspartate(D-aspartate) O-methyltransferase n=2 Tax=unclassified Acidovorax TaxID=2684926 RepID=UPI00261297E5|nr:protein-L-isoaspartate(D-aspartate) O-methyltransferase [Acidovorax sp.]MDH4415929.1 protein-L-isoaspartate(D-aspartate) O-methyltransferase [Acidovorax sp.]